MADPRLLVACSGMPDAARIEHTAADLFRAAARFAALPDLFPRFREWLLPQQEDPGSELAVLTLEPDLLLCLAQILVTGDE